jgi:aminocarboxymuconate-semialdehyde decarboxylase
MANPPKDYLRNFYYGNLVHDDEALRLLIERVGTDRITIGTDDPFPWDHLGGSANWIRSLDFLSEDQREEILWRNAVQFLRLDGERERGV